MIFIDSLTEFSATATGPSHSSAVDIADAIASEGAVIVRGALPRDSIGELRGTLVRCLDEDLACYGPGYRFRGMVHALMTRGAPFLELLANPTLRRVSQKILGDGCIVHAFNSSSLPPRELNRGQNHSRGIHVDCPRLIPNYLTNIGWIFPLDPFTEANGAMELLPQSFTASEPPSEEEFAENRLSLAGLAPGDACCFNARCWHRGGINATDAWRHAVTVNVTRSYMRQQFDYPRMMDRQTLASLPEDTQRFLGYHVRMPTSLAEFQLPPDQRPYRPGQE
jgi:ectoine hydroxylase-related dioxygenase (phytanoyl-CoA dioxygenase family)